MRRSRTLLTRLLFIALWIIGSGLFVAGVGALAMYAAWFPDWMGFGADALPAGSAAAPVVIYQQEKTLWDWLQLLLVPLVLTLGGLWLTTSENRAAREAAERQVSENTRIEDERRAAQERLEQERAHDAVLQAYLDHMTDLLLNHNLRMSTEGAEVRSVARARTLTALRVLDASRKGTVVQFLSEANLIQCGQGSTAVSPIIALSGAQLAGAQLAGAQLAGASLAGAQLAGASLAGASLARADLRGADLSEAQLSGAQLSEAQLSEAQLSGANLTWAQLAGADLTLAQLAGAQLAGAQLAGAGLIRANLTWAQLRGANLIGAELGGAQLRGADLGWAQLAGAGLTESHLERADLTGADLTGADLRGARLQEAHLSGADLRGANPEEATYGNISKLEYAILDDAQRKLLGLPPKLQPKLQPPDTSKGDDEAGG